MNNPQPQTMYDSHGGLDSRSLGLAFITLLFNNIPQSSPVWLDSAMKALASVAAISTITYNAMKMWMEIMGKPKTPKMPKLRKPRKNKIEQ